MPEKQNPLKAWLPLILQSAVFLISGWGYATSAEHRVTVVEESLRSQQQLVMQIAETQKSIADQLRQLEKIVNTQIVLEDYIHRVKGAQ